jgi:Collagen triple helix repeat (20 copies)
MFSRVCKHINPATIMAFVALVFAVTGGAFAATGGGSNPPAKAIASTARAGSHTTLAAKKKPKSTRGTRGPAGPKGATGTTGATGPAGPAGSAGAKGETGAAGATGNNGGEGKEGKAGESVTVSKPSGSECNGEGGAKVANVSGAATACNGKTGFTDTLPAGKTETGAWSIAYTSKNIIPFTAISFPIPLAANKKCQGVVEYEAALCGAEVHYVNEHGEEEAAYNASTEKFEAKATSACPGTVAEPAAEPGNLCVYQGAEIENANEIVSGLAAAFLNSPTLPPGYAKFEPGAALSGAILQLEPVLDTNVTENYPLDAWGAWAVTAQ